MDFEFDFLLQNASKYFFDYLITLSDLYNILQNNYLILYKSTKQVNFCENFIYITYL